jgi:hypothetical protein
MFIDDEFSFIWYKYIRANMSIMIKNSNDRFGYKLI